MAFGHSISTAFFRGTTFGDLLYAVFEGPNSPINPLFRHLSLRLSVVASFIYALAIGRGLDGIASLGSGLIRKSAILTWIVGCFAGVAMFNFLPCRYKSADELTILLSSLSPETTEKEISESTAKEFYFKYKRPIPVSDWDVECIAKSNNYFGRVKHPLRCVSLVCSFPLHEEPALATSKSGMGRGLAMLYFDQSGRLSCLRVSALYDTPFGEGNSEFSRLFKKRMPNSLKKEGMK